VTDSHLKKCSEVASNKHGYGLYLEPAVFKEAIVQVLSEGQCIKHEQYGFGIVAESDSERTTIDFDSVGLKKFVTNLMSMELVGEAPERPTKPRRRSKKAGATAAARVAAGSSS
jgi:hypothetical protein